MDIVISKSKPQNMTGLICPHHLVGYQEDLALQSTTMPRLLE